MKTDGQTTNEQTIEYLQHNVTDGYKPVMFPQANVMMRTVTNNGSKIFWFFDIEDEEHAKYIQQRLQEFITYNK